MDDMVASMNEMNLIKRNRVWVPPGTAIEVDSKENERECVNVQNVCAASNIEDAVECYNDSDYDE